MASTDYKYFILVKAPQGFSTHKPGQICRVDSSKLQKLDKKQLDVIFTDALSGLGYQVELESLEAITREEAELLMALPEGERLSSLTPKQALRSARQLKEGTEVWVERGTEPMKGIIRYIGNITEPKNKWDIPGIYYGIELLGSDRGKGSTNGYFQYKKYFPCDKYCGEFATFNRVFAVGPQTSPDTVQSPTRRTAVKHKPDHIPDQPMSIDPDHFKEPASDRQRETRSEEAIWDIPKPLCADPPEETEEPMDQDHLYEEVDTSPDPANALSRSKFKSQSVKSPGISEGLKTRLHRPGSAKRASPPRPQSQPEETMRSYAQVAQTIHLYTSLHKTPPGREQRSPSEETGPRSGPQTGERTGPRTGPQPRVGPNVGGGRSCEGSPATLKQVSADGLNAGDQVLFFDDQEQLLRGTVLFMETVDNKFMVHIAAESGMPYVMSLECIIKMEQEPDLTAAPASDSEDLYMDPDATTPPKDHSPEVSLGVESVVEINMADDEKAFGTIRWIGLLPDKKEKMVGLELEEMKGVNDGTFKGCRYFKCPEKHALFVKLSSCRPDSRFAQDMKKTANHSAQDIKKPANHNGLSNHYNHTEAGDPLPEPVPPISTEQVKHRLIGRMRGIQGHHNSCYMDSALFSLFSCSSVLDSLLFKWTDPQDAVIQKTLLRDIVNPLRRNGFVEGRHVMNLRQQLQKHGFSKTFTTDEKDPEEFLTVIMHHILALDPLLKLCSGGKVQDSYCYQIFLDQNHSLVLPTVQQLLEHSFYSNAIKLAEVPSCLILQMPRFGKKFKMFDKIIPSLELDVTDLLEQGPKQCMLCGGGAHVECSDCFLDPTFGPNGFKVFCDRCSDQVHLHPHRRKHQPSPLLHPGLHHTLSTEPRRPRERLQLLAVLCIETSHYVSFVKYGSEPEQWLFFDSMADREGEADGYNVPEVSLAPEIGQYLSMSLSELSNQAPRDMRGVAKRLLCDAYLYLYTSSALSLYT